MASNSNEGVCAASVVVNKMNEKKKFVFNWGHGIAVFFSIFVITTISILVISFTKTFDLQTENYYQEELVFEEMITKKKNVITELSAVLSFSAIQNNDKIGVIFFSDTIEKFILYINENITVQKIESL